MPCGWPAITEHTLPDLSDLDRARALQTELAQCVRLEDGTPGPRFLAGVDVGFDMGRGLTRAAVTLFDCESRELVSSALALVPTEIPYIPGFLSFREIPAILPALAALPVRPDLLMVDGQGVAHPRRLGIAAHLGVLLDCPALGVAKSILCGRHAPLAEEPGSVQPLTHRGETIGTMLRSKARCKPLIVSAGHRMTQATALALTRGWLAGFRLPEPTRQADSLSKTLKG